VCKLNKSLYDLKQAPRTWFPRFTSFLSKLHLCSSKLDTSLFVLHRGNSTAYFLLYVDDIVLTTSHTSLLNTIIHQLRFEFAMTDLGRLVHFLGISVQCTCDGLFLSQQQYASELLDHAHMSNCNPCLTPVDTKSKSSLSDGNPLSNPTEYHSWCPPIPNSYSTRYLVCRATSLSIHASSYRLAFAFGQMDFTLHQRHSSPWATSFPVRLF
jgi:hypothetical protein